MPHTDEIVREAIEHMLVPIKGTAQSLFGLLLERFEQLIDGVPPGSFSSSTPNINEMGELLRIIIAAFNRGLLLNHEGERVRIVVGDRLTLLEQHAARCTTGEKDVATACMAMGGLLQAALPLLDGPKLCWPDPDFPDKK